MGEHTPALSILQPWVGAILHAGKRIENRQWRYGCNHRGAIWLHASKSVGPAVDFDESYESISTVMSGVLASSHARGSWKRWAEREIWTDGNLWLPRPEMPRGAIVGYARIVDVIRPQREDFRGRASDFDRWVDEGVLERDFDRESQRAWWVGGFALVLDEVVEIEPVPAKGALGLWRVPEEIEAQARAALGKVVRHG